MKTFNQICKDIQELKIQGATNVAKASLKAYSLNPSKESIRKLSSLRPTEPATFNSLKFLQKYSPNEISSHFETSQNKINELIYKKIRKFKRIYTHCHSSTVVKALIYSKKKGLKFLVLNTETRPLYQGRETALQLAREGIKVEHYVDSGMHEAIKKAEIILLGADAILEKGVLNKIGSSMVGEISKTHKKPLYIVSDSWKHSVKDIKIEERNKLEIWNNKSKNISIQNPSFDLIIPEYVTKVISELGILRLKKFIKKASKKINSFEI